MKILVVTQYFYPEQFRINDICFGLVNLGHEVTVATEFPNYPSGKIFQEYEKYSKDFIENIKGVTVYRCKARPRNNGTFQLLLNYFSFVFKCKKMLRDLKNDFDIIYVYGLSPITLAIPAIYYKKKHKIPIYMYCLDIWPASIMETGQGNKISTKNPVYILCKKLSQKIYNKMDFIGNKCEEFVYYLNNVCQVPLNKMNFLAEHAEDVYLNVSEYTGNNKATNFMFFGNIGRTQNCEMIVEAANKIKEKDFCIHFIGDGSELSKLKNKVKELSLENHFVFHGRVAIEDTIELYEKADVCILTLSDITQSGITPPGKLFGYLASGRPTLASAGEITKKILDKANAGICVGANDIDSFAKEMNNLIEGNYDLRKMSHEARMYFLKNHTLNIHLSALLKKLMEMRETYHD